MKTRTYIISILYCILLGLNLVIGMIDSGASPEEGFNLIGLLLLLGIMVIWIIMLFKKKWAYYALVTILSATFVITFFSFIAYFSSMHRNGYEDIIFFSIILIINLVPIPLLLFDPPSKWT